MSATGRGAPAQSATADREIVISRVISAPRELVFEAFTEVRHLSVAWYFSTASSRSFLVGNTARISIRVAAPSGANFETDSNALGSPWDSPCSSAIRSGAAISVQEIHS